MLYEICSEWTISKIKLHTLWHSVAYCIAYTVIFVGLKFWGFDFEMVFSGSDFCGFCSPKGPIFCFVFWFVSVIETLRFASFNNRCLKADLHGAILSHLHGAILSNATSLRHYFIILRGKPQTLYWACKHYLPYRLIQNVGLVYKSQLVNNVQVSDQGIYIEGMHSRNEKGFTVFRKAF